MAKTAIQDLNQQFPITTPETGQPSDYFMRYLRDRGGYLTELDSELAGVVDDVAVLDAEVDVLTAALAAKADKSVVLTAGVGLSGGGDLSTNRTFDLEDTAVAPGTYTSANVTVDQQGRITAVSSGSGSGLARPVPFGFGSPPPTASEVMLVHIFSMTVNFAANWSGSVGTAGMAPTSSFVLTVTKNGAAAGTITISTGGAFTFATPGGLPISFSSGDVLKVIAPATVSATLTDVAVSLYGVQP